MASLFKDRTWMGRVLLFATLVMYTLLGAAIFQNLESELPIPEVLGKAYKDTSKANVTMLLEMLMDMTCKIPDGHRRLHALYDLFTHGKAIFVAHSFSNFGLSAYYCGSVYTTIGYGDMAPGTPGGRFATVVYALVGIPLFLAVLADTGKTLAYLARRVSSLFASVRPPMNTITLRAMKSLRRVKRKSPREVVAEVTGQEQHSGSKHSLNSVQALPTFVIDHVASTSTDESTPCKENESDVIRDELHIDDALNTDSDGYSKCSDGGTHRSSKLVLHVCASRNNLTDDKNPVATLQVESVSDGEVQVTLLETPETTRLGSANFDILVADEQNDSRVSIVEEKNYAFVISNPVAFVLFVVYVLIGALMFSHLEEWTYLNSVYFVVVTLLTIGFGDLTPSSNFTVFAFVAYSFLGLALASMYLNLLQENVRKARKVLLLRVKRP